MKKRLSLVLFVLLMIGYVLPCFSVSAAGGTLTQDSDGYYLIEDAAEILHHLNVVSLVVDSLAESSKSGRSLGLLIALDDGGHDIDVSIGGGVDVDLLLDLVVTDRRRNDTAVCLIGSLVGAGEFAAGQVVGSALSEDGLTVADVVANSAGTGGNSELLGDVNDDGEVDNGDALLVLKYDAGVVDEISDLGDVNGDGEIDNSDALQILKYDAGIIDSL